MKAIRVLILAGAASVATAETQYAPAAYIPPPNMVALANVQPKPAQPYTYVHRLRTPMGPREVIPDKDKLIERFGAAYTNQNQPKFVLFINPDASKTEHASEKEGDPIVGRRIAQREIEDAFGSPFRSGGAAFVDARVASLSGSDSEGKLDSISKRADIAIELLLEERGFGAQDVAGNYEVRLPVVTATAIRLSDSQIVGRVTSMGVFGLDSRSPEANATALMVRMTPSEIAREIAFALMRDLVQFWNP